MILKKTNCGKSWKGPRKNKKTGARAYQLKRKPEKRLF